MFQNKSTRKMIGKSHYFKTKNEIDFAVTKMAGQERRPTLKFTDISFNQKLDWMGQGMLVHTGSECFKCKCLQRILCFY